MGTGSSMGLCYLLQDMEKDFECLKLSIFNIISTQVSYKTM